MITYSPQAAVISKAARTLRAGGSLPAEGTSALVELGAAVQAALRAGQQRRWLGADRRDLDTIGEWFEKNRKAAPPHVFGQEASK